MKSRNKNSKGQEVSTSNSMGDPDYAEHLTTAPVLVDNVGLGRTIPTDTGVGKPVKHKKLL